jgi:hypothetical protein
MGQILFLLIVALLCFWGSKKLSGVSTEGTEVAKKNYEKALQDGNRIEALTWGRKYYESLRWNNGYRLTIYDEQKIQNDINVFCTTK